MVIGPGPIQLTKQAFPIGNKPHKMTRKLLGSLSRLGEGTASVWSEKKGVKTLKLLGLEWSEAKSEWVPFEVSQFSRAVGSQN